MRRWRDPRRTENRQRTRCGDRVAAGGQSPASQLQTGGNPWTAEPDTRITVRVIALDAPSVDNLGRTRRRGEVHRWHFLTKSSGKRGTRLADSASARGAPTGISTSLAAAHSAGKNGTTLLLVAGRPGTEMPFPETRRPIVRFYAWSAMTHLASGGAAPQRPADEREKGLRGALIFLVPEPRGHPRTGGHLRLPPLRRR